MLKTILEQSCLYLPLALGMHLSFNLLKIADLGIEASYLLGAIVATKIMLLLPMTGVTLLTALIVAGITGALIGLATSMLTLYGKVSPLLSGIIAIGITQSLAYIVLQGSHQSLPSMSLSFLQTFGSAALVLGFIGLLSITHLGYTLVAYGVNQDFFTHHGISQKFVYSTGLVVSNALGGLSGFLVASTQGFADLTMAQGIPLTALCILTLGILLSTLITTRSKIILFLAAPLVGTISYFLLQHTLLKLGVTSSYFPALQGLMLVACIIILALRQNLTSLKSSSRSNI